MALTEAQLPALKAAILAETDSEFVGYRTNGQVPRMVDWLNTPGTFIVWRTKVMTSEVGKTVNYVAVTSLTDINRGRITTFYAMNPVEFEPRADVRTYWSDTFSGTLGGEGANTRAALDALWRRAAKRGDRIYATGIGTTLSPGTLVFEGDITDSDIQRALEA